MPNNRRIWKMCPRPDAAGLLLCVGLWVCLSNSAAMATEDTPADAESSAVQREVEACLDRGLPVSSLAFRPDGRIVTVFGWATAIVWDAATGEPVCTWKEELGAVESQVFSPDGRSILTASLDGTGVVRDSATGKILTAASGLGVVLALGPNARRILTGGIAGRLESIDGKETLRTYKGHSGYVFGGAFSANGKRIVTGSSDGSVVLWDAATGEALNRFEGHSDDVASLCFSPDGRRILSGSDDSTAILWDARTGRKIKTFEGHTDPVCCVAFSPDGRRILTGSADGTAILRDVETGKWLRTFGRLRTICVESVAISPDGRRAVTGSTDNTAVVWDARTGKKLKTLRGHSHDVISVALSHDARQLLTGSRDGTAILWGLESGKKIRTFSGHGERVFCVAFSPPARVFGVPSSGAGKRIVTGSCELSGDTGGRRAIVWDANSGERLATFEPEYGNIFAADFSPNGRRILAAGSFRFGREMMLWDSGPGSPLRARVLEGRWKEIECMVFSPDARRVLAGWYDDGMATVWDVRTGRKVATLDGHSGRVMGPYQGHSGRVTAAAFSLDGRRIATGSFDRTAILWDAETYKKLRTLKGHSGRVLSVALSADGRRVVTGSDDGSAIIWDGESGKMLFRLYSLNQANDWVSLTPEGEIDGSPGGRELVRLRKPKSTELLPTRGLDVLLFQVP